MIKPKLLWHCSYWDGPINGVCEYNGERLWFQMFDEADDCQTRLFKVYRISPEEMQALAESHELFCKYVGGHTDYNEDGTRNYAAVHPESEWPKFYENYKPIPINLEKAESVGMFWRGDIPGGAVLRVWIVEARQETPEETLDSVAYVASSRAAALNWIKEHDKDKNDPQFIGWCMHSAPIDGELGYTDIEYF